MITNDVIVIGGGLSGLAAATYLARAGMGVTLCEQAAQLGGRARTRERQGYAFNLGPHALYARGAGARVLAELGVRFSGGMPAIKGGYAFHGGRLHTMPVGLLSLLSTGMLRLGEKFQLARVLAQLPHLDPASLRGQSVAQWLAALPVSATVVELLAALIRLSSYCHAPTRMDAGAAVAQLQLAVTGGVYYLDRGWQTLVDGLTDAARAAGVAIRTGTKINALTQLQAANIVIATDPGHASALLGRNIADVVPVRAACLDLALRTLPRPQTVFTLGIDAPLYFSVHTQSADLAPASGAVVHVARYLAPGETGERAELEALVDTVQPGWRQHVVEAQFMPKLTVTHAMPTLWGRPACSAGTGIYLAGDWVGDEGMLADAALASARQVAALITGRTDLGQAVANPAVSASASASASAQTQTNPEAA